MRLSFHFSILNSKMNWFPPLRLTTFAKREATSFCPYTMVVANINSLIEKLWKSGPGRVASVTVVRERPTLGKKVSKPRENTTEPRVVRHKWAWFGALQRWGMMELECKLSSSITPQKRTKVLKGILHTKKVFWNYLWNVQTTSFMRNCPLRLLNLILWLTLKQKYLKCFKWQAMEILFQKFRNFGIWSQVTFLGQRSMTQFFVRHQFSSLARGGFTRYPNTPFGLPF